MTSIDDAVSHTGFAGIHALSSRGAGYAVALKCLQVQAEAEARDPSLKSKYGLRLHDDAWPWYTGALGEIEVGRMLAALGPEWLVRHSVPIGADTKDVDHLVIGPGGVFAINTKHHRGASVWIGDYVLRVNNANTAHLNIARGDGVDVARRLKRRLGFPVAVTSVIAVLGARSFSDIRAPENREVAVVEATQLTAWLTARPLQLDETTLALIKLAAEEPETWHVDPHTADTLRVMQRFERLVAAVGSPRAPATVPTRASSRQRSATRPWPRASTPTRRVASKRNSGRNRRSSVLNDLAKLCFAVLLLVVALSILHGYAH